MAMNITKHIGLWTAMAGATLAANAQSINFETVDYASIGVYDTWENSPFRTGALQGNVKVVSNHLKTDDGNTSEKILGVQRSIYGSNTFGARVDLITPLETGPTQVYVHVLMHKPVEGRVMLIGLGKRTDRPEQSTEVEQFWTYPVFAVPSGEWTDAVFPVKTNAGVEIHSLVIVPHCEAPHELDGDFVAYIDDIVVNDSNRPRIGGEKYPINYDRATRLSRSDRYVNSLTFTTFSDGEQRIDIPDPKLLYKEIFDTPVKVKVGGTVNTAVAYTGYWMHSYLYLDKGNDGEFSTGVGDGISLDPATDLVSFSLYSDGNSSYGKNSAGTTISNSNSGFNGRWTPPAFTVPADMTPGIYRMRYKLDWNNIDPGGDPNEFVSNGGTIIDMLLNVHNDNVTVRQDNRNGEITLADGTVINAGTVPFGEPLTIKMNPSNGFTYSGVRIRHGYNLTGDSLVQNNPQFRDDYISYEEFGADDTYTIPASMIDGDVLLEGLFVENGTRPELVTITYKIKSDDVVIDTQVFTALTGDPYPTPNNIDSEVSPEFYTLAGMPEGTVGDTDEEIELTLENNLPFMVSRDFNNVYWYNMTLTDSRNYLTNNPALNYISLGTATSAVPSPTDYNSQWAFVGNVLQGFKVINRGAGEGFILSSSTNTAANTGGNTYPVMTAEPVPDGNNTFWIPTVSSSIAGQNGFYLHQLGLPNNRMNSRDNRLAYWTGGVDAGSTFLVTLVESLSGIGEIGADNAGPAEYYNLQGVRVSDDNLTPGIYIVRKGNAVGKILVK